MTLRCEDETVFRKYMPKGTNSENIKPSIWRLLFIFFFWGWSTKGSKIYKCVFFLQMMIIVVCKNCFPWDGVASHLIKIFGVLMTLKSNTFRPLNRGEVFFNSSTLRLNFTYYATYLSGYQPISRNLAY